jgi:hypothetical protein
MQECLPASAKAGVTVEEGEYAEDPETLPRHEFDELFALRPNTARMSHHFDPAANPVAFLRVENIKGLRRFAV